MAWPEREMVHVAGDDVVRTLRDGMRTGASTGTPQPQPQASPFLAPHSNSCGLHYVMQIPFIYLLAKPRE